MSTGATAAIVLVVLASLGAAGYFFASKRSNTNDDKAQPLLPNDGLHEMQDLAFKQAEERAVEEGW